MSHFSVLVITEKVPTEELLKSVLLPFHEYECTGYEDYVVDVDVTEEVKTDFEKYKSEGDTFGPEWVESWNGAVLKGDRYIQRTNPNKKWDWYQRGGRFHGKLVPRKGAKTLSGGAGVFNNDVLNTYGVDSVQLKGLDLASMQNEAEERALERHNNATKIIDGRTFDSWETIRNKIKDVEVARKVYWEQQVVKDFARVFPFDKIDEFLVTKEEYLKAARDSSFSTFAVLKDGKWYQRGEMGWWGMVADEKDKDNWNEEFTKLVNGLDPETWLTVVDCHI